MPGDHGTQNICVYVSRGKYATNLYFVFTPDDVHQVLNTTDASTSDIGTKSFSKKVYGHGKGGGRDPLRN